MTQQAVVRATIVGAGHNGLVAATLLARAGLQVTVLERASVVGGAARTEQPFAAAPGLGASTGAYLLGLMPPELVDLLGLELPLVRRDPHYFLPSRVGDPRPPLLLGSDPAVNREAITRRFSRADADADAALGAELAQLREDLAPAWLAPARSLEETAERYLRPALRDVFTDLVRRDAVSYLRRFGFASDELLAMYAITDGTPGLDGSITSRGSGANFLAHNMGRLPGSGGTWMVVRGGMGTVTSRLADLARGAGATITTDTEVVAITATPTGHAVHTADGREIASDLVVINADPFRALELLGDALPADLRTRIEGYADKRGTTLKINLAMSDLPTYPCLPERVGQHGTTTHLLPDVDDLITAVDAAYATTRAGGLADAPPVEVYTHTAVDDSLRDEDGNHSAAMFVQWVPNRITGTTWAEAGDAYADRLLRIWDEFAPGASGLVVDRQVLHPEAIETHFGLTHGHIFHVDNSIAFDQRLPHHLGIDGVYACGAGCHPAGSVIGAAGHNAAQTILADLGLGVALG